MKTNITIETINDLVGGVYSGHSFFVTGITAFEKATEQDLVVLFEPEDGSPFPQLEKSKITETKAGVILAKEAVVPGKNYLLVADPLAAYTRLVEYLQAEIQREIRDPELTKTCFISPEAFIDPSVILGTGSIIESGARIGARTIIGAQCFIGRDTVIGNGVLLHPSVTLLSGTIVGDGTIIHSGTVIGSDGFGYRISRQGLRKIPHIGRVVIGRMVELGANVTIDRAVFTETSIGDAVKIDNGVHIAHNVTIGAGTAILAQTGIAGSVVIGKGCQIGGQVAIKDHITIGDGAKIVSKSGVMKDVKSGDVLSGIPAMPFSEWKRMVVALTKLSDIVKRAAEFEKLQQSLSKQSWFGKLLFGWFK